MDAILACLYAWMEMMEKRREKIHREGERNSKGERGRLVLDVSMNHLSSVMRERKTNTNVGWLVGVVMKECGNSFLIASLSSETWRRKGC